nr:MAG TPA: hypothetical protein [Caudoviricetes sp.]DAY52952.1 MAG TPA: hypothetical protein [Caudoviricetes sp.]DAY75028.1 MAG TPA: hypothetical protein [Caudoviricetes sp.]
MTSFAACLTVWASLGLTRAFQTMTSPPRPT